MFSILIAVYFVLTRYTKAFVVQTEISHPLFIKWCRKERGWGDSGIKGVELRKVRYKHMNHQ